MDTKNQKVNKKQEEPMETPKNPRPIEGKEDERSEICPMPEREEERME